VVSIRVPLQESRDASYDILIERGLLDRLPALLAGRCPAAAYAVIGDSQVAKLYGERVTGTLRAAGLPAELFTFPAGEWNKTRDTWTALCDRMLAAHIGRDAAVLAVGGGVTGDLAGFVAATYHRGIPWVQVPTTLLAMIDSSIGGKTGVDTPQGKNLLGAFHQPRLVAADPDVLATLAAPQLAAGMAEAIKHAVIADAEYFAMLERCPVPVTGGDDPAAVERVVARSVEIKAKIVAADEREAGARAALNFGHTIGHALEATSGYALLHGEAVAIGMVVEARLAEAMGVAEQGTARRIAAALERHGLPVAMSEAADADALLDAMRQDKKVRGGALRFALPSRVGALGPDTEGEWTVAVSDAQVRHTLQGERELAR
jgi:3-dehydroquinate synthase